jgi:hypothetical protein
MANAKVNKQITSFADATRVTPVPGTDDQFEATIHWDWCGGLSVLTSFLLDHLKLTADS